MSAILIWALEHGYIDSALVSYLEGDGSTWKAIPGVARTKEQILEAAGSRYTYCANTMAYAEAIEGGAEKIALVGMSCQSSVPPVMTARKAGKVARKFALNIGLLCSKTFDDAIFEELFEAKYGLKKQDMKKMNIKGVFQIWMKNGDYHEVPLKECHAWTREGCKMCPDFAAEHADISTGGIGKYNDWTLTVIRTDLGREIIIKMLEDGSIIGRPGDDDPGAIALMRKLSKSRAASAGRSSPSPSRSSSKRRQHLGGVEAELGDSELGQTPSLGGGMIVAVAPSRKNRSSGEPLKVAWAPPISSAERVAAATVSPTTYLALRKAASASRAGRRCRRARRRSAAAAGRPRAAALMTATRRRISGR